MNTWPSSKSNTVLVWSSFVMAGIITVVCLKQVSGKGKTKSVINPKRRNVPNNTERAQKMLNTFEITILDLAATNLYCIIL